MNDLISRQAAIDIAYPFDNNERGLIDALEELPTADVRENEHACWILDPDGMDWGLPAWKCSRCGCVNNNIGVVEDTGGLEQNPFLWAGSKYCPNCGAQMERRTE